VAGRLQAPALFSGNPETANQVRQLLKEGPGADVMGVVATVVGCALIAVGVWGSISTLWRESAR
jgi:hypothetical protein